MQLESSSLAVAYDIDSPNITWFRRVACGPGATTTLEPTFAFKRAVYDAYGATAGRSGAF
eukprot:scaffold52947_cov39-Phaeocystis_antarctica.AAC.2